MNLAGEELSRDSLEEGGEEKEIDSSVRKNSAGTEHDEVSQSGFGGAGGDGGEEDEDADEEIDLARRHQELAAEWREGPDWANLDIQIADELDEIELLAKQHRGRKGGQTERDLGSESALGSGRHPFDSFLVERSSPFFDQSFSQWWSSSLRGPKPLGEGFDHAETRGILLHYDTDALPTVLDVGSEIPPGVVRFLGSTLNGGWRNPAKHTARTGVSVIAAGKWWDEVYSNGTQVRVRGSPVAAFDVVNAYVDEHRAQYDEEDWPAPAGMRRAQPAIGVSLADVLEWSSAPSADYLAVHQGWFTLDIGRGRRLLPRAYCMRNGGSRFACPISWILEGAESRQGPWFVLDARGFDWVNLTDNWEPLYKELAEGQKHVFPHDHVRGGWKEPEDGYVEPVPHHGAVWRVRNPDESGQGYRFFRLAQMRARQYDVRRMVIQVCCCCARCAFMTKRAELPRPQPLNLLQRTHLFCSNPT